MEAADEALVAELARRSGLVWVGYGDPPRDHPVWHVWHDGAVAVVSGAGEQPLPGIEDQAAVRVVLRSRTTRHAIATVDASVEVVRPDDDRWDDLVATLAAARLNLAPGALERWAADGVVTRLVPRALVHGPGRQHDRDLRAEPWPSEADTAVPTGRRRPRAAPPLSG